MAVSIPFFAGVFRGSSEFLFQNSAVALISLLFSLYLFWVLSFDGDVKQIGLGERIIVSLFVSFLVFCVGLGVSFIPTEPFLRALFLSAALMFGTGYVYSHYKNKITKDLLLEYGFILLIFFLIVLTF